MTDSTSESPLALILAGVCLKGLHATGMVMRQL